VNGEAVHKPIAMSELVHRYESGSRISVDAAACRLQEAKPSPPQAANEKVESSLQNTAISAFDTYPPKPVADADLTAGCAGEGQAYPSIEGRLV
jgi:hypothetical protein